jgi:UDP-galactopyranose mutase
MTTLMAEYPRPHLPGETIAYYPIPRDENQLLYAKYAAAAQAEFPLICCWQISILQHGSVMRLRENDFRGHS